MVSSAKERDTASASPDAERQVIGALLIHPERIGGVARNLQPRDFADPYHRATFDVLVAMRRGGQPVDVVTVKQRIEILELFSQVSASGYLAETGGSVINAATCDYHAGIVAEASRKRRLGQVGSYITEAAANGHSSGDILADLGATVDDLRREIDPNARELESWPLDEFLRLDHRQNFLINGVVTEAQPGCISAKSKSNKTTMALAMAMAGSTGRPFLGHYEVPAPVPTGIISAESGGATLAESFERVAASMGLFASEVKNLHVSTKIPLLTTPEGRDQLERHILRYGLKVQYVDPTYKAFAGVDDTQLSQMALHLFPLSDIIDRTGCSIVMVHHNRKSPARQGDHYAEPTQDDIQGTGFQQWARFFVLLNKRREWDANEGRHWLWFKTEGSAGFGSRFHLNLHEGLRSDPGGRCFDVELVEPHEGVEQERVEAEAAKDAVKLDSERRAVCDVLAANPAGLTWTRVLRDAKVSSRRWEIVKEVMVDEGDVIECEVTVSNHRTPQPGVKLATAEAA